MEPAGALALAGMKKYLEKAKLYSPTTPSTDSYCAILSGANMNFDRLRFVAERAQLGERREALLSVVIPEKAGSFLTMMEHVLPHVVTEFSYRYADKSEADIYMSILVDNRDQDVPKLIEELKKSGMRATDISDNELAKSHARYLIAGRPVENERVFRFGMLQNCGLSFRLANSV